MSETIRSTAINNNCSLTINRPPERIIALDTGKERVELGQGQYFLEKNNTYELWKTKNGLQYRIKGFRKASILWVFTE